MKFGVFGFDWDEGNTRKCSEHGVSRETIEGFFHGRVWVGPDLKHSLGEERFIAIGRAPDGRPMFVAFAWREISGRKAIRPITARYMHQREANRYEEAFAETEE